MKLLGKILLICALLMGTYGCEKTQDEPSLINSIWLEHSLTTGWPVVYFLSSEDCFLIDAESSQYIHFTYSYKPQTVYMILDDTKHTITKDDEVVYTVSKNYQGTISSDWRFMQLTFHGGVINTIMSPPNQYNTLSYKVRRAIEHIQAQYYK